MPESFREKVGALTGVRESERGLSIGMGPEKLVGRLKSHGDMRGTIARFLKDYPQFRSLPTRKVKYAARGSERWGWLKMVEETVVTKKTPDEAWWNLPPAGKKVLQEERLRGKYGGLTAAHKDLVPYFAGHDKSTSDWAESGKKANLHRAPAWVKTAVEKWRKQTRPRVLAAFRRRMGYR